MKRGPYNLWKKDDDGAIPERTARRIRSEATQSLILFLFLFLSFLFHPKFLLIEGDEIDQEPLAEFNDQFESSTDFEGLLCASDQEYEALNEDSDAEGYLSILSLPPQSWDLISFWCKPSP